MRIVVWADNWCELYFIFTGISKACKEEIGLIFREVCAVILLKMLTQDTEDGGCHCSSASSSGDCASGFPSAH